MASSSVYLEYVLEQFSGLGGITYRKMMGEYILCYQGKIFGGIYDDRFLVKDVPSARDFIGDVILELPYDGAKPMILVADVDNKEYLIGLIETMASELPASKKH